MVQIVLIVLFAALVTFAVRMIPSLLRAKAPSWAVAASAGVGFLVAGVLMACFTQVAQSHIGIVTTFGKVQADTLTEGAHLVAPVSRVHEVFIGTDVARVERAQAASKDLQSVHTDLTMNYRVDPAKARALFAMAPSLDYEASYVQPAMQEVFKAVVSRYTAEELVTKRAQVSTDIQAALVAKLAGYGFVVRDINITGFAFSKAFDDAIEAKVTASQKAEQAERDLQRVKYEADQKIATAKGDAEAIAIQATAIKTNGGEEYLRLQAINRWDGKLPLYLTPGAPLPFVNAGN
ncbi:prohibitin family protein [Burkholderia plantarii]|uniref:prohibitin family protein n=1 Tax=Burkholderia plantarii TaxID=41899 RepID=UPI00272D9B9F|nr:prohibitin family protein [Burkholderia plantarii]WLE58357.1 prohibitin family protein [Burkholderia plantarii]